MHPHKGVLSMSLFSFLLLFRHQYSSIHGMIIVIYRYIEVKIFFCSVERTINYTDMYVVSMKTTKNSSKMVSKKKRKKRVASRWISVHHRKHAFCCCIIVLYNK